MSHQKYVTDRSRTPSPTNRQPVASSSQSFTNLAVASLSPAEQALRTGLISQLTADQIRSINIVGNMEAIAKIPTQEIANLNKAQVLALFIKDTPPTLLTSKQVKAINPDIATELYGMLDTTRIGRFIGRINRDDNATQHDAKLAELRAAIQAEEKGRSF